MGNDGTNWELGFRQCSFHHAFQVLRVCNFSAFSLPPAFPSCSCPLAFRHQVRRLTSGRSSDFPSTCVGIQHALSWRIRAFMGALLATLHTKVSLQQVLSLLFERSGSRMETPSQVLYWVNSAGLSQSNRRLIGEIIEGLGAMDLQDQGKPIHVRLKDMPP